MKRRALWPLLAGAVCVAPSGCSRAALDSGEELPSAVLDDGLTLGAPVQCENPAQGIGSLVDRTENAGLVGVLPTTEALFGRHVTGTGGGIAIADIDADDDLDVLVGGLDGVPDLYINDGSGRFERRSIALQDAFGSHAIHIADMDGDGWPDLVAVGARKGGGVYRNEGDYSFVLAGSFEPIDAVRDSTIMTVLLGDLDGDGDLDVALPTMQAAETPADGQPAEGVADLILLQTAPLEFELAAQLIGEQGPTTSQAGWLTDRDDDGDLDLLVLPDRGPRASWWRSEGGLPEVDDALATGGAVEMSAMGLDSADLNEDGVLDVCISDVGPPRCLLSDGGGAWFDARAGMALPVDIPINYGPDGAYTTIGWSVAVVDLDADGVLDILQASGPEPGAWSEGIRDIGDVLWKGRRFDAYVDRSAETGFWSLRDHVGLATGDLDGDGFLEIVRAGAGLAPLLHSTRCTEGAWLQVRLHGPAENTMGLGAKLRVRAGDRSWSEEVLGIRDKAQGAPWQTFGLGSVRAIDSIEVEWPDGTRQRGEWVPTRRVLKVRHPDAVVAEPYPGR